MSLMEVTEYLLWKSIRHKTTENRAEPMNIKQEEISKQDVFDNDMICRVCTNPAEISITDKIENTLIISAIRTVANISITEADCYPKYVCKICLSELKIAIHFKKKCEESDMLFRQAISSETAIVAGSHPMVMHDFSLILHQMKQKRLQQKALIKNDEAYDDVFNNDQMMSPSPIQYMQDLFPTNNINLLKPIKRSNSISSTTDTIPPVCEAETFSSVTNNHVEDSSITTNVFVNHKIKRKKSSLHKCKRCNLKFDSKNDFQKHRKENSCIHHACPLCGKLVLNLENHDRIVHSRTHKYTCHQCGKIYYSSGALSNHMHKHRETKEFVCDHCPYRGKRKYDLVCHMRQHTGERRYLCSMCPLRFTNQSNLTKHQLVHFNKRFEIYVQDSTNFVCAKMCIQLLMQYQDENVRCPLSLTHKLLSVCSKCKRMFRGEKNLKEHFDSAHLNIRYRCSICGKDLSTRKKLLGHELRIHKREKNKLFEEVQRVVIGTENQ